MPTFSSMAQSWEFIMAVLAILAIFWNGFRVLGNKVDGIGGKLDAIIAKLGVMDAKLGSIDSKLDGMNNSIGRVEGMLLKMNGNKP